MTRTGALQQLQAADSRLAALGSELEALRSSIAGDPELDHLRVVAQQAATERSRADATAAEADTRASEQRRRARTLERQLFGGSIGNPQELLTLQRELEAAKERLAAEEEQLLSAMEDAEEAAVAAEGAEEAVAAREAARAASAGPDTDRLRHLDGELAEAQRERDEVAAAADPAALALYTRLATRVRPVVTRLQGDSCGGCRHGLGIHQVREVRHGDQVVQCPDCDRILVP